MVASSTSSSIRQDDTRVALARYYGLDRPLFAQYRSYLANLVQGDLGVSMSHRSPVTGLMAERLPWTLLLAGTATALSILVGIVAGVHSGWRRGSRLDRGLLWFFSAVAAFPVFFLASLALFVFAVTLRWVPLGGGSDPFAGSFGLLRQVGDVAHHLVLPASLMALQLSAANFLLMRAGMVGELGSPYLLLGRAKGLSEHRLEYRYAARNALLPLVARAALQFSVTVTVAVVFVETVFAYPGTGRLFFEALAQRDYPLLQGCFLVLTVLTLTVNFLADALAARLDPRITA